MAPVSRTGHRSSLHSISSSSSSLSKDMSDETESYEYRPVSPGSRKRHQSVPEKLTSLLQQHSPLRGHVSPVSHDEYEEDEPVTPPSVKKQRSTSDTTVLYPPYSNRFSQLSPPNINSGHLSKSKSTSPQPQEQRGNLTAFQSHLLKVHQVQHNNSNSGSGGATERHRRIGVHSPNAMSGSPGSGGGGTSHYSNYIIRENSPQEVDEREVEDIVGGAIRSSGQQDHQGETKCPFTISPYVCLSNSVFPSFLILSTFPLSLFTNVISSFPIDLTLCLIFNSLVQCVRMSGGWKRMLCVGLVAIHEWVLLRRGFLLCFLPSPIVMKYPGADRLLI